MITVRKSDDRGRGQHGWLDSRHSFPFANCHYPAHMGFSDLLVINEDRVMGGAGFGTHPHRDMEDISYVLEGALKHNDSLGTGSVIKPGEIQRMSAGTGIQHSEANALATEPVHFVQIWIRPGKLGIPPGYEQMPIVANDPITLLASPDGRNDSVTLHQDASVYRLTPAPGKVVELPLAPGRRTWLQVVRGTVIVNGLALGQADGLSAEQEVALHVTGEDGAEVLAFDLR